MIKPIYSKSDSHISTGFDLLYESSLFRFDAHHYSRHVARAKKITVGLHGTSGLLLINSTVNKK